MTGFSPAAAAFEGLRVVRRQPGAVAAWVGANILVLVLIAVSKLGQGTGPANGGDPAGGLAGTVARFGPLAFVAAPLVLIVWLAIIGAIFRQELRPGEKGWAFMRLGRDEARLGVLAIIGAAIVLIIAGLQFAAIAGLTLAFDAYFPAASTTARVIATAAASCLNFWIVVRLSLAPAHTFAQRRVSMFGSWALTRRHFWELAWMILLMIGTVFVVFVALALVTNLLGGQILKDLTAHRLSHPNAGEIASLLVLIFLPTAAPVLVFVLVYSPLAFAYRALSGAAEA
jgi:hypothetical protein